MLLTITIATGKGCITLTEEVEDSRLGLLMNLRDAVIEMVSQVEEELKYGERENENQEKLPF